MPRSDVRAGDLIKLTLGRALGETVVLAVEAGDAGATPSLWLKEAVLRDGVPTLVIVVEPPPDEEEDEDGPRYACPECGAVDRVDVVVQCWARIIQTDPSNLETDIDTSDQEWDDESLMRCGACGHTGLVPKFAEAGAGLDPDAGETAAAYSHTYSVTRCPMCESDLTGPDGVVIETYEEGVGHGRVPSRLDKDGGLIDVGFVVANGKHSDTRCGGCDAPLNAYEV